MEDFRKCWEQLNKPNNSQEKLETAERDLEPHSQKAVNEIWQKSVQGYPEVLEYFFGLVEYNLPSEGDLSGKGPPFLGPSINRALINNNQCTFWAKGQCAKGDNCTFRHNPDDLNQASHARNTAGRHRGEHQTLRVTDTIRGTANDTE